MAGEVVPPLLRARGQPVQLSAEPQDQRQATLIRPFRRADGWIDWRKPAVVIDRQVRALQPWPGAWTTMDGKRLHVRAAHPTAGVDGVPVGALLPGDWPEVACGRARWPWRWCSQRVGRPCRPMRGAAAWRATTSCSAPVRRREVGG